MCLPEAVAAGSGRFCNCHQQPCRPQGSAAQRRPPCQPRGWLEVLQETLGPKGCSSAGTAARGKSAPEQGHFHEGTAPTTCREHPGGTAIILPQMPLS